MDRPTQMAASSARLRLLLLAPALVCAAGCGEDPRAEEARRVEREAISGRVQGTFRPPLGCTLLTPSSRKRVAEFRLADPEGETAPTLAVFGLPPSPVRANLERWSAQFEVPGGGDPMRAAVVGEDSHDGLRITTMDLAGTLVATSAGGAVHEPDQRMLGAVVEPLGGASDLVYFVRVAGPAATVAGNVAGFEDLLARFHELLASL